MIGLYLDDPAYEQDIRELLMAFYPGQAFVHDKQKEPAEGLLLVVEGALGDGTYAISLQDRPEAQAGAFPAPMADMVEVDCTNRHETKNQVKRMLYHLLEKKTGRSLPWGSLTGIRPAKIPLTMLSKGKGPEEIKRFMKEAYLVSDEKADLSIQIAQREASLLSAMDLAHGYSIYLGIPFCPTTCLYCSFTSFPIGKWEGRTRLYLEALFQELEYVARKMDGRPLEAIYMGGGTPTSLPAGDLEAILSKLEETFDMGNVQELTVEAGRPDSITREKLQVLKSHGVTRISINPQTMNQKTLDLIGRRHTVDMVKSCFAMAREMGFDNINMDLIAGLPGEGMEELGHTIKEVEALDPDGMTVHSLAIKRAARLNMFRQAYENLKITNTQEMVDLTARCAKGMGMEPYYLYRQKNMAGNFENVGYAKPGKECIYNVLIMEEQQAVIGCGAGTTTKVVLPSTDRIERAENVKEVEQYIRRIEEMLARKEKLLAALEH